MADINKEQEQKLWEWCGFKKVLRDINEDPIHNKEFPHHWLYPNGELCGADSYLPKITLDSLFKRAVPKGFIVGVTFRFYPGGVECEITYVTEAGFDTEKVFVKNKKTIGEHEAIENSAQALALALLKIVEE